MRKLIFCIAVIAVVAIVGYGIYTNKISKDDLINAAKYTANELSNEQVIGGVKNTIKDSLSNLVPENTVKETKKYELKDTFGSGEKTKEVEAEEMVIGEGYAGASNNAYYIKDGKLYHMTLDNFKEELLAENVENLVSEGGEITVVKKDGFKLVKEHPVITYIDKEGE